MIPLRVRMPVAIRYARLSPYLIIQMVLEQYPYANHRAIDLGYRLDPMALNGIFNAICPVCLDKSRDPIQWNGYIPATTSKRYVILSRGFFGLEGWLQFHAWIGLCKCCNNVIYDYDRD